ncbi:MAG: adaptor protein MecA [Desulfitobacteriaceae bacterium]|nr:adaptor protein MecA [Desulfitobacteriaceae bacterium]
MRVQKVNDYTIRIFISFTELADRDISMTDLFQRSSKTEQLFWELIAQAREEVEFNLDQPFWIQATVASNDEFVITVMKQEIIGELQIPGKEKARKKSPKSRILERVYVFEDFEDLLSGIKNLPGFRQLDSALFEFEGLFYLSLKKMGAGKKKQLAEAMLVEYGEICELTRDFLLEHGKLIIGEQAVQILNTSFNKPPSA